MSAIIWLWCIISHKFRTRFCSLLSTKVYKRHLSCILPNHFKMWYQVIRATFHFLQVIDFSCIVRTLYKKCRKQRQPLMSKSEIWLFFQTKPLFDNCLYWQCKISVLLCQAPNNSWFWHWDAKICSLSIVNIVWQVEYPCFHVCNFIGCVQQWRCHKINIHGQNRQKLR